MSTKQSGTPTEVVPNHYSIMLANCEHFWLDLLHYQQKISLMLLLCRLPNPCSS